VLGRGIGEDAFVDKSIVHAQVYFEGIRGALMLIRGERNGWDRALCLALCAERRIHCDCGFAGLCLVRGKNQNKRYPTKGEVEQGIGDERQKEAYIVLAGMTRNEKGRASCVC